MFHKTLSSVSFIHKNSSKLMIWECSVSLIRYNLNPVINLVSRMIIWPELGLVHISSVMTLYFSYLVTKRPLQTFYCIKQILILMCLILGVILIIVMWCIWPIVCPHLRLSTAMRYFLYVKSVQKLVSTFLIFPVGNHSFISSILR